MKELIKSLIKNKSQSPLSNIPTNDLLSELLKRKELPFYPKNEEEELKINIIKATWDNISAHELYYVLNRN